MPLASAKSSLGQSGPDPSHTNHWDNDEERELLAILKVTHVYMPPSIPAYGYVLRRPTLTRHDTSGEAIGHPARDAGRSVRGPT